MDNITFGQYVPGNSWIYKLDPRIKIFLAIVYIVLLFILPNLISMAIALGVFLLIFISTRISLWKVIKGLKTILFLLLFTVFLQIVYTTDSTYQLLYTFNMQIGLYQTLIISGIVLFWFFTKKFIPLKFIYLLAVIASIFVTLWLSRFNDLVWNNWDFLVYYEGVERAGYILIRLIVMIGITSLLTLSTMTTDINNGIEGLLSPLKLLHINVGVFSMLISLTLRFIPTLIEESRKIMKAQASRGVDFEEGKLKDKVKQIISLLIPMFIISFKRADELSNAMEARGYVIGDPRTKLDELKLKWRDYLCLILTLGLMALVIWSRIYYA